ncbi:hypothetical protein AB0G74_05920 [Streptomyces sp. NPDC020875]|uniref:hypothetical protein n=1 Tax=Streptomyces sp. NPDC020875 TaxID=3154898 RepID=UPI0033D6BE1A
MSGAHDDGIRTERYGPDGPLDDRTGNGIVNNGPEHEHDQGDPVPPTAQDAPDAPDAETPAPDPDPDSDSDPDPAAVTDPADPADSADPVGPTPTDETVPVAVVGTPDTAPGSPPDTAPVPAFAAGPEPELDLGRLLQGAVGDLRPADGALDRLRTAVPARRARKRQLLIGAVAAVVLTGTAVPALLHVADAKSDNRTNTANAGHERPTGGNEGGSPGTTGDREGPARPQPTPTKGKETTPGQRPGGPVGEPGGQPGVEGPGKPGGSGGGEILSNPPTCGNNQLMVVAEGAEAPDANGTVYGSFRIANRSDSPCVVNDDGDVSIGASGAADMAKLQVVEHVAGDAAPGLPDPSAELASALLKPGEAYEVKFAFVPGESCPTGNPSPDPTATEGTTGGGAENPAGPPLAEGENQQGGNNPAPEGGTVYVQHVSQAGAAVAETVIDNVCAGTVYRTGVLSG